MGGWLLLIGLQCSERCGRGFKYRAIQCVTSSGGATPAGQPVEAYYCGGVTRKPAQSRGCYRYQCPFAWQIGEWSEVHAPQQDYNTYSRNIYLSFCNSEHCFENKTSNILSVYFSHKDRTVWYICLFLNMCPEQYILLTCLSSQINICHTIHVWDTSTFNSYSYVHHIFNALGGNKF